MILKGEVIFSKLTDGIDVDIGHKFTGEYFGEGALITNEPRRATAKSVVPTILLYWERESFSQFFGGSSVTDILTKDYFKCIAADDDGGKMCNLEDLEQVKVLGTGIIFN